MTTIYEVTFKETGEKYYYTSLVAIGFDNDKSKINLSPTYVQKIRFSDNVYENKKVVIRKLHARGKSDLQKEKLQS